MSLSKLLPTLDNAGRRLVLSEILGDPVALKMNRTRLAMLAPQTKGNKRRTGTDERSPEDHSKKEVSSQQKASDKPLIAEESEESSHGSI
jgi:hypothetical protein